MVDILLFVFLTIFFIFKLKNVFGVRNNDDEIRKKTAEDFFKLKNQKEAEINETNEIITNNSNTIDITNEVLQKKVKNYIFDFNISNRTQEQLLKIDFDQEIFLKGAEIDVEMISEAFSRKDTKTLEKLLSKEAYSNFKKQIEDLSSQGRNLKSSLISVLSKTITNINVINDNIFIDVLFNMEQINFIENDRGEVVFGTKRQIQNVKENWTFERSISSLNNFWIVKTIKSVE